MKLTAPVFASLTLAAALATAPHPALAAGPQAVLRLPAPLAVTTSSKGAKSILATCSGLTVYVFDRDETGRSACSAKCAEIWPPVSLTNAEVVAITSPYGVITRETGLKQLTLEGRPLYTFHFDRVSGDVLGDGIGGVWHVPQIHGLSAAAARSLC